MSLKLSWIPVALALSACGGGQGVGLGPVGYGGPATLPASTRTEVVMEGLTPLPVYRYGGAATPANAATVGGSALRQPDANLAVEVDGSTYLMRQIEIGGKIFVVAEGAVPVGGLPSAIKARTGCLVAPSPLRSKTSTIYTLDCS